MYWDVLWTALPSESVPCTLGAVFVDGKDKEAMLVLTSDSSSELRALHIH